MRRCAFHEHDDSKCVTIMTKPHCGIHHGIPINVGPMQANSPVQSRDQILVNIAWLPGYQAVPESGMNSILLP